MTYYQECMFGEAEYVEIIPKYRSTQNEINVKTYNTPEELLQKSEQELEAED